MLRLSTPRPQAQLRSVVLRGCTRDPLRARLSLERLLSTVDWSVVGLPSQALVFVRKLHVRADFDPEGALSAATGQSAGPWPSRIAALLREQGRAARRPWSDARAVDADAVWFEDEDELAACLVRDWLRGVVAQCWWWRSVLTTAGIDVWLRTQLLSRGERLAPTLQRLAAVSLAAAWVARMDDADARTGFDALTRAYALPHAHARADAVDAMQGRSDAPDGTGHGAAMTARSHVQARIAARRRLQRLVPELDAAAWRPAQARLLAHGLALLRAPAEARTRAFADDVAAWRPVPEHALAELAIDRADDVAVIGSDDDVGRRDAVGQAMPSRTRASTSTHLRPAGTTRAGDEAAMPATRAGSRQHPASSAMLALKPAQEFTETPGEADARDSQASTAESATFTTDATMQAIEPLPPVTEISPSPVVAPITDETVPEAMPIAVARTLATVHGGLFYVLNAALSLGVYGDFSMPRTQGISLSPWDLLAWLGLHWFGRAFRRDPLWGLLANLAGRSPKRAPSWRIDPPSRWEPDDDWLRAWAPITSLEYAVDRRAGRLHVLHPDGFAVFDVPRDPHLRPAAQARALCLTRGGASAARLRSSKAARLLPADPGQRWLHRFADYLAARFMRALGTTSPHAAVALLCRHAAEVRCDASRVEVALTLSTLPLPVRVAGLDRDPGWIPAAGRDVRFHFS